MQRGIWRRCVFAVVAALLGVTSSGRWSTGATAEEIDPPYRVVPVFFAPSDYAVPSVTRLDRANRIVEEARRVACTSSELPDERLSSQAGAGGR